MRPYEMLAAALNVSPELVATLLRRAYEEDGKLVDVGGLRAVLRHIPARSIEVASVVRSKSLDHCDEAATKQYRMLPARRELVVERYVALEGATLAGMMGEPAVNQ